MATNKLDIIQNIIAVHRQQLIGYYRVVPNLISKPEKTLRQIDDEAKQAIEAYIAERVVEAQNNGVAWTVSVVDDLHLGASNLDKADQIYKGVKNTIRDRYKVEVGIDPAPSYPVHVELKSNERVKDE